MAYLAGGKRQRNVCMTRLIWRIAAAWRNNGVVYHGAHLGIVIVYRSLQCSQYIANAIMAAALFISARCNINIGCGSNVCGVAYLRQ